MRSTGKLDIIPDRVAADNVVEYTLGTIVARAVEQPACRRTADYLRTKEGRTGNNVRRASDSASRSATQCAPLLQIPLS